MPRRTHRQKRRVKQDADIMTPAIFRSLMKANTPPPLGQHEPSLPSSAAGAVTTTAPKPEVIVPWSPEPPVSASTGGDETINPGSASLAPRPLPPIPGPNIRNQTQGFALRVARFDPGAWLDDDVINDMLQYFTLDNLIFHAVSPIIFNAMAEQSTQAWWDTYRGTVRRYPKLLMPVCSSSHWVLVTYEARTGDARLYDSLRSTPMLLDVDRKLRRFLTAIFGDQYPWSGLRQATCPQQPNTNDCGLHTIRNADLLILADQCQPPLDETAMRAYYREFFLRLPDLPLSRHGN